MVLQTHCVDTLLIWRQFAVAAYGSFHIPCVDDLPPREPALRR
jgi:hypothetical protein